MIKEIPYVAEKRDADLISSIGMDMKSLAYKAVGVSPNELPLDLSVGVVPVTSGLGVTKGFTESVCTILAHLGMRPFLTKRTDVAGLADALASNADLVFMADDNEFIALNVKTGTYSTNVMSTALGYVTALKIAAGGLKGKEVLLIGAGRVGSRMADMLESENACVTVTDIDISKAKALQRKHIGFKICEDVKDAISKADLVLNASPGKIPGEWIKEGSIYSSPGMPFSFDEEGLKKMKILIHDPLQIGVSVMAVWSASLSIHETSMSAEASTEVIEVST